MAELKTKLTTQDVTEFLHAVPDARRREECFAMLELLREATSFEPRLWGTNLVGFGAYRYTYASGRSGEWPIIGFSPRKSNLTLYIMDGFERYEDLLQRLGQPSHGTSCLYLKNLAKLDREALQTLIRRSVEHMRAAYPPANV